MDQPPCSIASLQVREPLGGTAVESVDRWILLEVTDTWAPKAIRTEALSEAARSVLERWLQRPRTRLQLIRRPGRPQKRPLLMLVSSAPGESRTARIELESLDDIAYVQPDALPASESTPICLVCVHGRRDRCCAQHGAAVFRAIHAQGVEVWQTSHLGGHRFAACALWLPEGLMYGRLRAEDAEAFVAAHRAGEVGDLDRFRGRCALDRPTQAAEIFLRRRLGSRVSETLEWQSTERHGEDTWHARFRSSGGEESIRVRLEHMTGARPASCGGDPEPVTRFVEVD